jgi:hypothetical protein
MLNIGFKVIWAFRWRPNGLAPRAAIASVAFAAGLPDASSIVYSGIKAGVMGPPAPPST